MIAAFILICAGTVLSKQAVSLSPWNVFNDGVSRAFGVTFGQACIIVSATILAIDLILKQKVGYGSLYDIFISGLLCDLFLFLNRISGLIPRIQTLPAQIAITLLAVFLNSFGLYLYMSAGLGTGPVDTLYVAMAERLHMATGLCKLILEALFCFSGWLLGGEVGICTLVTVAISGPMLQLILNRFHFDPTAIRQESVLETTRNLFRRISG